MEDKNNLESKFPREYRSITLASLGVIVLGTVVYHYVEHLSWLDAVYFSVITLTTVGYGDIVPHTDVGKIFTIFYVLIGFGIIAIFAHSIVTRAAKHRLKHLEDKRKKLENS